MQAKACNELYILLLASNVSRLGGGDRLKLNILRCALIKCLQALSLINNKASKQAKQSITTTSSSRSHRKTTKIGSHSFSSLSNIYNISALF